MSESIKNRVVIRRISDGDRDFVLRVNAENVEVLSPMDAAGLDAFLDMAELMLLVEVDGTPAAFLIGMREGEARYQSENYRWFCSKYDRFLYIDRVVIDEPYRSMGVGREIYDYVFEHARKTGVPYVTAEIDTIPYNGPSLKFHEAMGFREVGTQYVRNNMIRVSLQEARTGAGE